MPITSTKRKEILMVRFAAPDQLQNRNAEYDIVCYLRLSTGVLEINYSHHIARTREGASGPFTGENKIRFPMDAVLRSTVMLGVFQEFWSWVDPVCRVLPAPLDVPISLVEF